MTQQQDVRPTGPLSETPVDRRGYSGESCPPEVERREFLSGGEPLSAEAHELALAIDGYKLRHRRRFISHEEILAVVKSLGYRK